MTTEQLTWITCGLCGETGPSTAVIRRMTTWHEQAARSLGRPRFDVLDRCRDEQACRGRVEQVLGEPWPIDDRTVATVAVSPPDNPMPPPPAPAAVADEEDIEWMR